MPKERSINPVAAQHKADKQKQLKKSKASVHAQRNEKLARRNPERLQRQIDDLKSLAQTQQLRPKDKATLDQLEKDLRAVKKAREALGDKAPAFAQQRRRNRDDGDGGDAGTEGRKRRRVDADEDDEETDEDVRRIPMPRDTPPPIPRKHHQLPDKPVVVPAPAQTTYSSAPVLRDLAQESRRFVPAAVAQNIARQKGLGGRLLEPEEADKLQKAGYNDAAKVVDEMEKEAEFDMMSRGEAAGTKEAERALRQVEMEEVEDEGI